MEIEILFSEAITKAVTNLNSESQINWTPVITTLGGALIGAAASIIPQKFILNDQQKREADAIRSAFNAEIKSITDIIEKRKLKKEVIEHINFLKKENSDDFKITFEVRISNNYNINYKENIGKIGLLEKNAANNIVRFYHILDSIICDIGPEGHIAKEGGKLNDFISLKELFDDLSETSKGII